LVAGQNGVNADGLTRIYAAALAAAASHAQVEIAFDNASAQCYVSRMNVKY
jgi:hypothetical protein